MKARKMIPNIDMHEWQLAHIQKGVEAARKGDFASDEEVKEFIENYGDSMRWPDSFSIEDT